MRGRGRGRRCPGRGARLRGDDAHAERVAAETAGIARSRAVTQGATRGCGANIAFAPVINMFMDPRYGRFQEGFSPNPTLSAHYATAAVDGLQGGTAGNASTYLPSSEASVIALGKHFAG